MRQFVQFLGSFVPFNIPPGVAVIDQGIAVAIEDFTIAGHAVYYPVDRVPINSIFVGDVRFQIFNSGKIFVDHGQLPWLVLVELRSGVMSIPIFRLLAHGPQVAAFMLGQHTHEAALSHDAFPFLGDPCLVAIGQEWAVRVAAKLHGIPPSVRFRVVQGPEWFASGLQEMPESFLDPETVGVFALDCLIRPSRIANLNKGSNAPFLNRFHVF